jgi:hypothetical protein
LSNSTGIEYENLKSIFTSQLIHFKKKNTSVSINHYATKGDIVMTRGQKICTFIEHYCLISGGAKGGQLIKLIEFWRIQEAERGKAK